MRLTVRRSLSEDVIVIDELISKTFAMRDAAHREHWRTKSYAQHIALGEFYEALPDLVDEFVECYQGMFDVVGDFSVALSVGDFDMVENMQDDIDWMEAMRDDICQEDASLGNLYDQIVALYQRTLFKLKRLT